MPDPDGVGAGTASSPITTRYVYDALNHLRFAISAEGQVTEYRYDTTAGATWKLASTISYTASFYDVGALTENVSPSAATMTAWAAGLSDKSTIERADMIYDFRGNLSTVTTYSAADAAGNGLTSSAYTVATYVYDQFGLLLSKQLSGRTGSEVYTYDGLGRMLTSSDFAGNQTQIAYDNANRRTVMILANAETVTTNFNAFGQMLDTNFNDGVTKAYLYDANGNATLLLQSMGSVNPTTVKYRNDAYGQVLVREESKNGIIGPRQLYYYFAGARIGDVGNNGPSPNLVDYAQQLKARGATQPTGAFRHIRPVASADFDENYQPINAGYPGAAATSYIVRDGDTLYSVARALWGDQAMWFLIAEANGITAATQLVPGQRLIIPNKVTNFHNTNDTFRVYDPGEAIGDTMPTLPNQPAPPPAKKGGCGGFGAILLGIIAIAVTIVTAGAGIALATGTNLASGISTVVGTSVFGGAVAGGGVMGALGGGFAGTLAAVGIGAASAAAGSIASQGIGVLTGLQDSFSWKAVGLSALGGGLAGATSGLNAFGSGATGVAKIANAVVRSALTNAAMQGIGVATGLQDRFSWSGVAAAGVGAGAGSALAGSKFASNLGPVGGPIISGVAGGLAVSAAESLITGRDFGDTLMGNLPGMIVNTVGNIMTNRVAARGGPTTGAGDGAGAQPTLGGGGGQVRSADNEIIVTALRPPSYSGYTDHLPEVTAALIAKDEQAGGAEYVAAQLKARIVRQLAAQANAVSSPSELGYAALDALDGQKNGIPVVGGWAATEFDLTVRAIDAEARHAAGIYDDNVYGGIKASLASNAVMVDQWNTIADAQVNEVLRGGLAAVDIGIGGYNIAVGVGGLRDYLAVSGVIPLGKILGAVGQGVESGIARATRLGREGEVAAGISGSKIGVTINGRIRFPDEIAEYTIKEVKNVARQGWTRQLRDYSDLARIDGKTFELWVRPDTRISRILDAAEQRGDVVFRFIGVK